MDRRTYLKQLALGTGGVLIAPHLLVSCGDSASVSYTSPFNIEPFKTLDEIRHAIGQSAGHLSYEMERLITLKNAEAIFNFVQSRIATIPSMGHRVDDGWTQTRWGQRGLLRCGKGTLREKTDLLYYMLKEAGFKPEYFRRTYQITKPDLNHIFCVAKEENDLISIPEKEISAFESRLSSTSEKKKDRLITLDDAAKKAKELTEEILDYIPSDFENEMFEFTWLETNQIKAPFVRLALDQTTKDLNFVENLKFSELNKRADDQSTVSLKYEDKGKSISNIRIKINLTYSQNINEEVPMVTGEWDLQDIIGKQIMLQFLPTVPTEQYLQTPFEQINQFIPALTLRDPDATVERLQKQSFTNTGFDMFGNTFQQIRGGGIAVNGVSLDDVNPQQTNKITSIKAIISSESYPKIQIRVAPFDNNGTLVRELSNASFNVSDQQQEVQMSLLQNTIAPSVLVMYDTTSSMPIEYYAYGVPDDIKNKIAAGLQPSFGSQRYTYMPYSTDLHITIKDIAVKEFDHILFLGDGGEFKHIDLKEFDTLLGGVSASYHFIPNGYKEFTVDQSEASSFFNSSKRTIHHIDSLEADLERIGKQLLDVTLYPYVFEYSAPENKDQVIHDVTISVNNKNNVAPQKLRYTMNREKTYTEPKVPVGLWMEFAWDAGYDTHTHHCHLAGYNYKLDQELLPKHSRELKQYLLGSHYLFFEADKATLPLLLDELISSKLSAAAVAEAPQKLMKKLIEQLHQTQPLPGMASSAFAPILDATGTDTVTFENSFQSCMYSEYIDFEKNAAVRKINMLPTSDIRTFAPTKKKAFEKTLQQTCLLAISEGALFNQSTYAELVTNKLALYTGYGDIDFYKHPGLQPISDKAYYNYTLYDASFTSNSFWQVKKGTGALLGILPDGSGGGSSSAQFVEGLIKEIKTITEAYNKLSDQITKAGGLACNIVAIHGQLLIRLYGKVSVVLATMNSGDLNEFSKKAIKKAAYDTLKTLAYGRWKNLEKADKLIDKLLDPDWPEIKA